MEPNKQKQPVRVLLESFRNEDLVAVAYKLRGKGIEVAYWIGGQTAWYYKARDDKKNFPNTVFHEGIDCLQGVPAVDIDSSAFEPPSKEFLHSMLSCESQVLSMMNSVDHSNTPLSRKKQLYYDYLKYWHGVLTHLKIDAVLFHDTPHASYDYVIFCLAKKSGIKTIMYNTFRLPDRLIFIDDFPDYGEIARTYQNVLRQPFSFSELSPDLQKFYEHLSSPHSDEYKKIENKFYQPVSNAMRLLPSLEAIVRNLRRGTFLKSAYWYLAMLKKKKEIPNLERFQRLRLTLRYEFYKWRKKREKFRREYEQLAHTPDLSKNFIFVSLNMQPERSTSAQGDIFVNLPLMLDILSAALPKGWVIYAKEHPAQWVAQRAHLGRYEGYYRYLSQIPSVTLVPTSLSSQRLIADARAVAAVTGTSLWEAVLRGKPALMFGYDWYMHCEGVFRVGSVEEAKQAFAQIESGYAPDKNRVIKFLYALERVAVRGHNRRKINKTIPISQEEQIENLFDAFYGRLIK